MAGHPAVVVLVVELGDPEAAPELWGVVEVVAPGLVVVVARGAVVVVVVARGAVVVVVARGAVVVVDPDTGVGGTDVGAGPPPPPSEWPRDWPDTAWIKRTTPTASAATTIVAATRTRQRTPNTDPGAGPGRRGGPATARPAAMALLGAAGRPVGTPPAPRTCARSAEE